MKSLIAILLASPGLAIAGAVMLAWDPVPDSRVRGYEVGYGTEAGNRETIVSTDKTTLTISNIPGGATYFFAARAFGDDRAYDSAWSNEVSSPMRFDSPKNVTITLQVNISVQ